MADSQYYYYPKPPQFPPNLTREPVHYSPVELKGGRPNAPARKAKSFTHFLGKFLFFALFLVAIPLFPSQPPGFISQSALTKFWELVHLLFVGVAVSYGLLCRRNVDVDIETHTTNDDDSESYVSRVFRVSSIFEDEFDNSCGYGEKNVYRTSYSENYKAIGSLVDTSKGNSVMSEQKKMGSFNSESGFEDSYGYSGNGVNQAWNSQYFQGESMVVVAQPDCSLNRECESGSMMGHKSLNLPIRSLRSGDRDQDNPEISDGSESSSPSNDSSNSPYVVIGNEFADSGPTNLENRFDETDSFSPNPWRSRSARMEFGENVSAAAAASHSHFRLLSVDETQFESLRSKSLWSTESFSSQASSVSDSPNGLSPSHVVSSELENLRMEELGKAKMEELGKGKSFRQSYPPDSKPENKKASLNAFHIRQYNTNTSLFDKNASESFEDDSRDMSKSKRENPLSSDMGRSVSSNSHGNIGNFVKASSRDRSKSKRDDRSSSVVGRTVSSKFHENPENLVKASPRGRSVRTIRSRKYAAEAMKNEERRSENHFSDKLDQKASDEVEEAMYGGPNNMSSTSANKHDLDDNCPVDMPKATISELHRRKTREFSENSTMESKEEPAKETENVQVSPYEETVSDSVSDAGTNNPNEVDKKAGEFIAKFREQIRLQKMASIDRSRGRNYFK